ncbi:MAG: universal stress protein [Gammaproteobacteria bacterium]
MHTVRRILVAVKDPSARSLPAVAKSAQLAHALGAQLVLFHGIGQRVAADAFLYADGGLRKFEQDTRARQLKDLERIATPLRKEGLTVQVCADWDFPAHESIVREASRSKCDLIVAECHAGRRLAPWLMHLTDWELIRTSPVPVLLVKNASPWRRPVVLAALDPSHAFAKPARLDAEILQAGKVFTTALRGSLHAMHAYVAVPTATLPGVGTSAELVEELAAASLSNATKAFAHSLRSLKTLRRARRHLVEGLPLDAIPQVAQKLGSAIVVMGAISRSGLKRVLIGNTAEQVINSLGCDILVVKPARFVTHVARSSRGVRYVSTAHLPMPY